MLVDGFGLTKAEALPILSEWNQAKAKPPESERQVLHKIESAIKNHPVPSLKLLNANNARTSAQAVKKQENEKETHSEILLRLADTATLFHDESGRAFASVSVDFHRETHDILGSGFKRWLKRQFYVEQDRPPSPVISRFAQCARGPRSD